MHILLVAQDSERKLILEQGLFASRHIIVARLPTTRHLLFELSRTRVNIVVIETAVPDHTTFEQIRRAARSHPCPVIMFVQQGSPETSKAAVKVGVSAYVVDGLQSERVGFIVNIAVTRFQETRDIQKQLEKTTAILAGRKQVERAKGILMRRRKVEEDVAYHTLRKMAMSRNKHIVDVAESIITVKEMLPYSSQSK